MLDRLTDGATRWVGSTSSLIIHTLFFIGIFGLRLMGVSLESILLILTTAVSLEAIYLAIFIQRSVNLNTATLEEAAEDIQGIEEDIDEISEDVEDIGEDIEGIEKDIAEAAEDIEGIEGDIDDLQEAQEEDDREDQVARLEKEVRDLKKLLATVAEAVEVAKATETQAKRQVTAVKKKADTSAK